MCERLWAQSALLVFLLLPQLPLGSQPVLLVGTGLVRLRDQMRAFGNSFPRDRLARGPFPPRVAFFSAVHFLRVLCGFGIFFFHLFSSDRANPLAQPPRVIVSVGN